MLVLKHFQNIIRANRVDNGLSAKARESRFKVFERVFENHMSPEIFRQVYAAALLDEPDKVQMYYPRTDSLLVVLFNKYKDPSQRTNNENVYAKPNPVR